MPRQRKVWIDKALSAVQRLPTQAISRTDLRRWIEGHREAWGTPTSLLPGKITRELEKHHAVRSVVVERIWDKDTTRFGRGTERYLIGNATEYSVAISLRKGSYLSHASAIFAHGLSLQIPRTVYANREQSAKPPPKGGLTQAGIDTAFRNLPRTSNYYFVFQGTRILLLSGKATGRYGVAPVRLPSGEVLDSTDLERTLVDITVRPVYAGGVLEVFKVFKTAISRLSIDKLLDTLNALDHIYPYHQAIGFYLQRAGVSRNDLKGFRDLGLDYDFYVGNRIARPEYDTEWRLYYPREMQLIN